MLYVIILLAVGNALEKLKNLLGAVQEWEHKVKTSLKEK